MKMTRILLFLMGGFPLFASAQQDALYSQYMFNQFAINPAYAGSREAISMVLLHRSQWVGLDGAPQTTSLAVHSKLKGKKAALGFNMYSDRMGPFTNNSAFVTYAYHLRLGKGQLSMGLRAGMFGSLLKRDLLSFYSGGDVHDQGGGIVAYSPSFDAGLYYYTHTFYAGISASHISRTNLIFSNNAGIEMTLRRNFLAATGFAIPLSRNMVFRPSMMARYVPGFKPNVDVNACVLFNKVLWAGLGYRSSGSMSLLLEYNITHFMRAGYSYDLLFNRLRNYSSGSHELFIGFDFNMKKERVISPRYL